MQRSSSASRLTVIGSAVLVASLPASGTVQGSNLLLNPGAEQGQGKCPSVWVAASRPADGLQMLRTRDNAHSGQFAFAIINTHEYGELVSNNWAQNIVDVPTGQTVRLSARVRSQNADAVNVCVQCWDRTGKQMLAFASTPVFRGNHDWTPAKATPVIVPEQTAFITVRAALTGLGSAWFDDLSLVAEEPQRATRPSEPPNVSASNVPGELARSVPGRVVRTVPIIKDCMVLSYLPLWSHGRVDNIAVANNKGGVRTLLEWPAIPLEEARRSDRRFLIALYSRKTKFSPPAGQLQVYELLAGWPECTSWNQKPIATPKPAATFDFVPGRGWKLFDVTALVRAQAQVGRKPHGVMLRFAREDYATAENKQSSSGYGFVSREGIGEWKAYRPRVLVVEAAQPSLPYAEQRRPDGESETPSAPKAAKPCAPAAQRQTPSAASACSR